LLLTRRSIRGFKDTPVPQDVLDRIFEVSRYAPTSRNTQSYYFKLIEKKEILHWISQTRGDNSAPIGKAPLAVAICADPEVSIRHIQDGCIAAYHFILAAWSFGLGTCWIAAMDRDDVKEILKIPNNHYIATITPLGYPEGNIPEAPERKEKLFFVRQ
ncbi:nitroreductase family protein, partial [candidate division KSB1 bacterium]